MKTAFNADWKKKNLHQDSNWLIWSALEECLLILCINADIVAAEAWQRANNSQEIIIIILQGEKQKY